MSVDLGRFIVILDSAVPGFESVMIESGSCGSDELPIRFIFPLDYFSSETTRRWWLCLFIFIRRVFSIIGLIILTLLTGGLAQQQQQQQREKETAYKAMVRPKTKTTNWWSLRAPDVKTSRDMAPATASVSESFQSGMVRGRNEYLQ